MTNPKQPECEHKWEKIRKVLTADMCDENCPKVKPNDHGHVLYTGLLVVCLNCEEKKIIS